MNANPLRVLRRYLRDRFFALWRKALSVDDGRAAVAAALCNQLVALPEWLRHCDQIAPPYMDLGRPQSAEKTTPHGDPVFFTSRFRSGSTLTWNVFRGAKECVAYYEPLNERRWFDPAHRGSRVDPTHRGVDDYAAEYDGLEVLSQCYDQDWIDRDLLLDAGAWKPRLLQYLRTLVSQAPARPLLKFNRIDFRLPWILRHFPRATLVHLFRHPRDQWCSTLMDPGCFGPQGRIADFVPHDKFYLLNWARDLKYHFPFLSDDSQAHPYETFYFIWKLSYMFGVRLAHHSVAFESLVAPPYTRFQMLADELEIDLGPREVWQAKIVPQRFGRWRDYADDSWFSRIERHCELVLGDFFSPPLLQGSPPDADRAAAKSPGAPHAAPPQTTSREGTVSRYKEEVVFG